MSFESAAGTFESAAGLEGAASFEGAGDTRKRAPAARVIASGSSPATRSTLVSRLGCSAVLVGTLAVVATGLLGCQSIDMGAGSMAQLRLVDASPDAPAIDSYQNSSVLAYNLGFGTVTSYVPMLPGSYTLSADRTGTRQALVASTATLSAGHQYTGIIGNIDAAMQQTVLLDQSTPAPAGEVAVRLVDQATRAGAVDVYLVPKGGKLPTTAPTATNLTFESNSGYLQLPAGLYEIGVVPAGTVPVSTTVTLLSGAQVDYPSGAARTVVLIDTPTTSASRAVLASPLAGPHPAGGVQAIIADDCDPPNE